MLLVASPPERRDEREDCVNLSGDHPASVVGDDSGGKSTATTFDSNDPSFATTQISSGSDNVVASLSSSSSSPGRNGQLPS